MHSPSIEIIDAHHHLWHYLPSEYPWIDDTRAVLKRDFLPADLAAEASAAGIDGTVLVEARQTLEETRWLLSLADTTDLIRAVVGWAPIASPKLPTILEDLTAHPRLKALRHRIQDEPDDNYILRADFNAGIRALTSTGLVYDLSILTRHLPQTIQFVDAHPNQPFVLEHLAKPPIAAAQLEPWASNIRALALRPNVTAKLSGLATEADWTTWSPQSIAPYLDVAVEAFTPARLMAGSDWPVCLSATGYSHWFDVLRTYFAPFTPTDRTAIFTTTATKVYGL